MTDETFIARGPDGERLTCRVRESRAERIERRRREREEYEKLWGDGKVGKSFAEIVKADGDGDADDNVRAPAVDPILADVVDRQHGRRITFDVGDQRLTFPSERALAVWLAAQERIKKSEESNSMPTTSEQLEAARIAKFKSLNPVAVAKAMVEDNSNHGISEAELVELISNHDRQPNESAAKCFSRHYEAQDENGLALRKAVAIAKDMMMSIEPVFVGGEDACDVNDASKAYNQLMQMAEEQRARAPWKTVAQLFSDLMQDPKHAELAAKAHQRPRPTTSYAFPK